ncbi:MAG: hypothetical protein R3279_03600, partial [Putridiphycobacter sp.]|nr:hypothetical protein [Putridiphycobacter sp.]
MIKYFSLLYIILAFNAIGQKSYDWCFIENMGQFNTDVLFKHQIPGGAMFIEKTGITYHLKKEAVNHDHDSKAHIFQNHAFSVDFLNARPNAIVHKESATPHYFNFLVGSDKTKWQSKVRGYETIKLENLYAKIDLVMYDSHQTIKYDFIVKKGGKPSDIKLKYNNLDNLYLDKKGKLHLQNSVSDIIEDAPYVYQIINGKKVTVTAQYVLDGTEISYHFPNGYNTKYDLVIDPTLIMST